MQAKQVLHKVLENTCPEEMHRKRRDSLAMNVMAALHGQSLTVTHLGRAIESDAKEKHCIKRTDRLLSNHHLHRERVEIYGWATHWLIGGQRRPVIAVDWSDMDKYKGHYLLRAAIALEGRSLTLYEEVHTVETMLKPKTHCRFLKTLHAMLAPDCRPIIVSDAGFITPWFRDVEAMGWDWVGRVRNVTAARLKGKAWTPCKSLHRQATTTPKALGEATLAKTNPTACRLVLYKGKAKGRVHLNRVGRPARNSASRKQAKAHREPWLLATSLALSSTLAKKVVAIYRLRMSIEESFRDLKSTRFGLSLELHRTYQVERLQVLLLVATLALLVAWLMGKAVELTEQHRAYQANTVKDRKVLSTIFIGLCVIDDTRVILTTVDISNAHNALQHTIAAPFIDA